MPLNTTWNKGWKGWEEHPLLVTSEFAGCNWERAVSLERNCSVQAWSRSLVHPEGVPQTSSLWLGVSCPKPHEFCLAFMQNLSKRSTTEQRWRQPSASALRVVHPKWSASVVVNFQSLVFKYLLLTCHPLSSLVSCKHSRYGPWCHAGSQRCSCSSVDLMVPKTLGSTWKIKWFSTPNFVIASIWEA